MSILAVIVIVALAVLLPAMLVLGGRVAAAVRLRRELGPADDDVHPYRSHAEASRRARPRPLDG